MHRLFLSTKGISLILLVSLKKVLSPLVSLKRVLLPSSCNSHSIFRAKNIKILTLRMRRSLGVMIGISYSRSLRISLRPINLMAKAPSTGPVFQTPLLKKWRRTTSCLVREFQTESWLQVLGSQNGLRAIVNNSCLITQILNFIITVKFHLKFIESQERWKSLESTEPNKLTTYLDLMRSKRICSNGWPSGIKVVSSLTPKWASTRRSLIGSILKTTSSSLAEHQVCTPTTLSWPWPNTTLTVFSKYKTWSTKLMVEPTTFHMMPMAASKCLTWILQVLML